MTGMRGEAEEIVGRIIGKDPRYRPEAYSFVMTVVDEVQGSMKEAGHITGGEVLEGVRVSAARRFGPMAKEVLNAWGVKSTEDIGNIVFNLVDAGLLAKREEDTIDEFIGGYDFRKVFEEDYFGG